ncbi:hypothetical protein THIAE_08935 [Thiomicrospira aerophila AL3]|uniref:Uncharacterized protein n=1 Tax=Thiomicrospira aerophila AL3 TaxID=717772 RepID=W0DVA1_9GAMM|nr:hypothetical protein THIAE_08935 [Thiomicrospira aerophila AL3]
MELKKRSRRVKSVCCAFYKKINKKQVFAIFFCWVFSWFCILIAFYILSWCNIE